MSRARLVAVSLGDGLVVWHTREEWDRLMRGVDREASDGMNDSVDEFLACEEPR